MPSSSQAGSQATTSDRRLGVGAMQQHGIVPMLLVGVRDMRRGQSANDGVPFGAFPEEPTQPGMTSADASAGSSDGIMDTDMASIDSDGDVLMADAQERDRPQMSPAASSAATPAAVNASQGSPTPAADLAQAALDQQQPQRRPQSFVLWIMGGLYPTNHPLVLAPSLASDAAMSYEEMLRLAEVIGQHKPPTVSADEIAKSNLEVIKGSQVRTAEGESRVRTVTAERCLGETRFYLGNV